MQSIFIDITSYLQLCFTELPSYCVIISANSKLTGGSVTFTIGLLTFFLLVEYGKLSIAYLL